MLDLFRKRGVMSAVYSLLMGAVIVVFVVEFRPNANSPVQGLSKKCVAKVRGTCIDEKEWRAQRFLIRGQYDAQGVNWNKAAADSLIERTLLEQEAKRLGIRVDEDEVMNELVRWRVHVTVPVAMRIQAQQLGVNSEGVRWTQFGTKEKPFDQNTFVKVVQATTGQTVPEFVDSQEQELIASRMIQLLVDQIKVGDGEAYEEYKQERSTTTVEMVKLDPKFFTEHFAPVDQATVEKWAAQHKGEVDVKDAAWPKEHEKRLIHPRHILLEAKKDAPADKKAEAKKKADELLAKVKAGEDFAKLARENSTDPGSKDKGGEYDWTDGYEYVPEFRDGLAKLKPGEASVVETQFGFHVIQVMARLDGVAAVAYPLYRDGKGGELADQTASKIEAAMKGKIPVVLDAALKAKVEDMKKTGKSESDATGIVLADEAKARLQKAIDDALDALTPPPVVKKPANAAPGAKPEALPPPEPPWKKDDRRPHVEASSPFPAGGAPVPAVADQKPFVDAIDKLSKEAPFSAPVKSGAEVYFFILRDRHAATPQEFEKDRSAFMARLLGKKRDDAITNYLTYLRDTFAKEITVEQRYVEGEKKGAPGEAATPPPMPFDE